MEWRWRARFTCAFPGPRCDVELFCEPSELAGDAAANYKMMEAAEALRRRPESSAAHCSSDARALLGTGVTGPRRDARVKASARLTRWRGWRREDRCGGHSLGSTERFGRTCRRIRSRRLHGDLHGGETVSRLSPNCDHVGALTVTPIGTPASFYDNAQLELVEPAMFLELLAPRPPRTGTRARSGMRFDRGRIHR